MQSRSGCARPVRRGAARGLATAARPRLRARTLARTLARPLARTLAPPFALAIAIALGGARTAVAEPLDLTGTWYVLIHYRDPQTANPDALRWKDLVWVFEREGTRLAWTEYPLVFFEDASGRFERIGGNPRSRVLAPWEPNADQRKAIDDGPFVNQRGMKVKTLRGSDERGWSSPKRRPATSAMVMSYHETLTIEDLDGLPRFTREDVVGNATTRDSGGGTRYEVEAVERGGKRLVGSYERDGRQRGTFRMWRTPPVRGLDERDRGDDGEDAPALPPGLAPGGDGRE